MNPPVEIIDTHYVVVCGTRIDRPATIAPSQWWDYWRRFAQGQR